MRLVLAALAASGAFLLHTSIAGRPTARLTSVIQRPSASRSVRQWMNQAGLGDVAVGEFVAVVTAIGVLGTVASFAVLGALLPALAVGALCAGIPPASYRLRREARQATARDAWPRMIEEIRLRTGSLGRSIPQALFEVGARGPVDMRPAFEAAHREWLLTTDFERTVAVLKDQLADPTADVTCETLLVAHELGGADLGRRLEALVEDRILDLQGRKDARAKQAGARLARRFVLLVPIGMALAGMQVGEGREAYATPHGQVVALIAIALVAACWVWAGRIMHLPESERVFT